MDIPINADVFCQNESCGTSTYLVLNPTTEKVTHIVVKQKHFPNAEYLVPIDLILSTVPTQIHLRCSQGTLASLEPFIETEFIQAKIPKYMGTPIMLSPYVLPEIEFLPPLEHENIPANELALRRGARVEATDGHAGRIDEFLVEPTNGHITHLVLRKGHLWGQRDVTIPVSEIDRIEEDAVYLKLDKARIEALPAIPIRRGLLEKILS